MKRLVACAALLLGACAHAPVADIRAPDAGANPAAAAQAMAAHLADARELALLHPVTVQVQKLDAFHQSFEAKTAREAALSQSDDRGLGASWIAFGFVAPEGSAPDAGVSIDELNAVGKRVLDEQIAGFYDELDHTLHLPGKMPQVAQDRDPRTAAAIHAFMVAHELDHALQDQHFGFERLLALPRGSDAQLAMNSVFEGDAMLAAVIYMARVNHADERAMLGFVDRMFAPGSALAGKELANAPAILRERLVFPYEAGLHLCIAIYRTGGWKLVDQLFAHPPQTSEQVLHPEKYLAGEQAIPVRAPEPPAGMKVLARGTLGELASGVLVRGSANGWGGDAYAVAATGRKLALFWTSAWDTPEAAEKFEGELRRAAADWSDGPAPDRAQGLTISRDASIARRGNVVALIRGLPQGVALPLIDGLLALAGAAPAPKPPLGPLTLAPVESRGEVLPDGSYGSEPFGLYVPTPNGFRAIAEPSEMPAAALVVVRQTPYADGTFSVIEQPYANAQANAWFDTALHQENSRELEREPIVLGEAHGRESLRAVGPQKIRTAVVPACGGRASWVIRLRWVGEEPPGLEDWLHAFAPRDDAPACRKP